MLSVSNRHIELPSLVDTDTVALRPISVRRAIRPAYCHHGRRPPSMVEDVS
jgi:hypothetical protein